MQASNFSYEIKLKITIMCTQIVKINRGKL